MADVKISGLPAAGALAATDVLPIVQPSGTTKVAVSVLDSRWVASTGGTVTGALNVSPYIAVGTNPAQSGAVRLPNNERIVWRNAANNADHPGIYLGTDNIMRLASMAGSSVAIYSGTNILSLDGSVTSISSALRIGTSPASTGIVRLPNNQWIAWRNAANGGDIRAVSLSSADKITFGGADGTGGTDLIGRPDITFKIISTEVGKMTSTLTTSPNPIALGTSPAAAGIVRIPNDQAITARNAGNTADVPMLKVSTGNKVQAWNGTAWADVGTTTPTQDAVSRYAAVNPNVVANTPQDLTLTSFTMPFAGVVQMMGQVNAIAGSGATALEITISADPSPASTPVPGLAVPGAGGSMPANLYQASFPISAQWNLAAGVAVTIKFRCSSSAGASMGAVISAMSALIIITPTAF
jgi:hypothetical protein